MCPKIFSFQNAKKIRLYLAESIYTGKDNGHESRTRRKNAITSARGARRGNGGGEGRNERGVEGRERERARGRDLSSRVAAAV